ncbi:hypothetical protein [Alkalihalobacillus sp. CinArs1]|uniref:hypothetical protein n=1 Tax=Alkalihalobacillus sp. CinArs1 TaxID=2995314 RepID=UPI0022DDA023|nr:hypothetical protein [Alkalihalobacillus sp. CinArs1]
MGFYIVTIGLLIGSWTLYVKKSMNHYLLSFVAMASAVIFHIVGLLVSGMMHSQGAAFVTAYCAIGLLLNGILMLVVTTIRSIFGGRFSKERTG